jgi:hypothetical protein
MINLIENEKKYYDEYFDQDDIMEKMMKYS